MTNAKFTLLEFVIELVECTTFIVPTDFLTLFFLIFTLDCTDD